jgi:hypothetical protein
MSYTEMFYDVKCSKNNRKGRPILAKLKFSLQNLMQASIAKFCRNALSTFANDRHDPAIVPSLLSMTDKGDLRKGSALVGLACSRVALPFGRQLRTSWRNKCVQEI